MDSLTTFTDQREFERALTLLETLGIASTTIHPGPAYEQVGVPALVLAEEARSALLSDPANDLMTAGWVDYRPPTQAIPGEPAPDFAEDIVGRVAIVLLAPCVADLDRLRLTAHFSGDVAEALPYLNAELPQGSYVATLPVLTFMDGHRMVSLFRDRIAIAKADDIVDAWASARASALPGERRLVATRADHPVDRAPPPSTGDRDLQAPAADQLQGVR